MLKLALVGKNIQHSRSPEVYRKLISHSHEYHLLDYQSVEEIPSALHLLKIYDGISITSPYKKHFLSQVVLTPLAQTLGAINCLVKRGDELWGENTDYLAILEILRRWRVQYKNLAVIILGDGVMSNVTKAALDELQISHVIYSRKSHPKLSNLNLEECFSKDFHAYSKPLVINTCSRDFVFDGICPSGALFWDYNYHFSFHGETLAKKVESYVDGMEMLTLQAQFALAFWSVS